MRSGLAVADVYLDGLQGGKKMKTWSYLGYFSVLMATAVLLKAAVYFQLDSLAFFAWLFSIGWVIIFLDSPVARRFLHWCFKPRSIKRKMTRTVSQKVERLGTVLGITGFCAIAVGHFPHQWALDHALEWYGIVALLVFYVLVFRHSNIVGWLTHRKTAPHK